MFTWQKKLAYVRDQYRLWRKEDRIFYHVQESASSYKELVDVLNGREDVTIYEPRCECTGGMQYHYHMLMSSSAKWSTLRKYVDRKVQSSRVKSSMKRVRSKLHWLNCVLYVLGREQQARHGGHGHINQYPFRLSEEEKVMMRQQFVSEDGELAEDQRAEAQKRAVKRARIADKRWGVPLVIDDE